MLKEGQRLENMQELPPGGDALPPSSAKWRGVPQEGTSRKPHYPPAPRRASPRCRPRPRLPPAAAMSDVAACRAAPGAHPPCGCAS